MTSNRMLKLLAVATFAAASTASIQGAAPAAPAAATAAEPQANWDLDYDTYPRDGDDGGVSIMESASVQGGPGLVAGHFRALGEHVHINDDFDNDRATVVRLWVGGSGPAVFYGSGDGTNRVVKWPSYDEGQSVHLQVCTSDHSNAVCTKKKYIEGKS